MTGPAISEWFARRQVSPIDPDGGRTAGMRKVGSDRVAAVYVAFFHEFLEDGLDAHGSALSSAARSVVLMRSTGSLSARASSPLGWLRVLRFARRALLCVGRRCPRAMSSAYNLRSTEQATLSYSPRSSPKKSDQNRLMSGRGACLVPG
jgi:hypothetical protein